MLTFLEYRVLKAFSKFPNYYLVQPDMESNFDRVRFTSRKFEIGKNTKIEWFLIDTISDKLVDSGLLFFSSDITPSGLTELHLYWKNWRKRLIESLCKIYLPLIISLIAITLSLINFFKK